MSLNNQSFCIFARLLEVPIQNWEIVSHFSFFVSEVHVSADWDILNLKFQLEMEHFLSYKNVLQRHDTSEG